MLGIFLDDFDKAQNPGILRQFHTLRRFCPSKASLFLMQKSSFLDTRRKPLQKAFLEVQGADLYAPGQILSHFRISGGPKNEPLEHLFHPRGRQRGGRPFEGLRSGSDLGAICDPRLHFHRFGIVFGATWVQLASNRAP